MLQRHQKLIAEIARKGAEIGVHGYVHNDYRALSRDQQFEQTEKAISVFQKAKLPCYGFRNPYLGWTRESLEVYATLGFHYESNVAVLHDVVDISALSPLLRSGFVKSLELFQAVPCNACALRPDFQGALLRIPTSIPDDEMLFDRLRITDPEEVGRIWSRVMQRVYELGGLYTLNLHPERGVLCKRALDSLLCFACSRELPVWVVSIGVVAQWWKDRSKFRMHMTPLGDNRWRVEANCTQHATVLARHLDIEDQSTSPWYGSDVRVNSQRFIVCANTIPCIGVSRETPDEVMIFLNEQGYPAVRCTKKEALSYAMYIDKPAGLGGTLQAQAESKSALVEQIEELEMPLLHFGCWPDGNRAALAISGDIDSVTVQDFFLRIVEVFRHT